VVKGTCHCGNISIETAEIPTMLVSCNCSICFRTGALWGYYTSDEVEVSHEKSPTAAYSWGDARIAFHHCRHCGCVTHYTSTKKTEKMRTAINFRMVEREITESIRVRKFDGAVLWKFIDE